MRELTLQDVPLALEHFARQAGGNPLPATDVANIAAWIIKGAPQDSM